MSDGVIFSGISGVGKDYVLDRLKEDGCDFLRLNMGKLILDEMGSGAMQNSEDGIDAAFEKARRILMRDIGRVILNLYNVYGENLASLHSNQDRLITLPARKSVVIEAEPEIIVARREKDKGLRNRAQNSVDEVAKMQEISTEVAKAVAKKKDANIKIFRNDGKLDMGDVEDFIED